jgi:hypothetical protein
MAKLKTRDFADVEIMRVGTFKGRGCPPEGCTFTTADLKALARSAELAGDDFDAPLKLGHNDRQKLLGEDGLPAAGWLANLRLAGDRLVADYKAVPEKVADLIDAGGLRKRSAELTPNFKVAGKTYPWMVTGLALLGEELPAVDSLSDVTALYQTMDLALPEDPEARVFLFGVDLADGDVDLASIEGDVDRLMERIEGRIKNRIGAPTLRQLGRALKEGLRAALQKRRMAADDDRQLVWEETDNQIRHSVRPPADFVDGSFRTVPLKGSGGVSVVAGKLKEPPEGKAGSMTTQSLRFDKKQDWTMAKAKAWASSHDFARTEDALTEEVQLMDEEIRKLLGLDEGADVMEALRTLKARADAAPEDKGTPKPDAEVERLRADLTTSDQRVLTLERESADRKASELVDGFIRETRLLPAQRDTAIAMALRDHDGAKKFFESQPKGVIELGERGSADTETVLAELEPTPQEVQLAKDSGLWSPEHRIEMIRQKALDKGVDLPTDFGKESEKDD